MVTQWYPEVSHGPRHEQPAHGRFVVSVEKWSGGWDLHIDGDGLHSGGGVTQVTNLDEADAQVRSYLQAVLAADFSDAVIDIALPHADGSH
jgi:hypothetical protein